MHPAFSVIFLTTLLGVGQGLFMALITAQFASSIEFVEGDFGSLFYSAGSFIVLLFLGAGLIASFFHLGHPERAWRAVAMWRTSWLSREVIALPIFMGMVGVYMLIHWFELDQNVIPLTDTFNLSLSLIVGLVASLMSIVLFICTGMIYASIRFLQEWATPLTVINFTLLGMASGFTFASVYAAFYAPELINLFAGWAVFLTLFSATTRIASLFRNSRLKPKSTPTSAIGVRHPKIVQSAQGAMGGSFNTREYFHGQPMAFVKIIKWVFIVMVFIIPFALLGMGLASHGWVMLLLAFVIQYIGLIAERWFFFAQANHPQNIYYQAT